MVVLYYSNSKMTILYGKMVFVWCPLTLSPTSRLTCGYICRAWHLGAAPDPVSLGLMESRLVLLLALWATKLVEKVMDWGIGSLARDETHPDKLERLSD